MAFSETILDQAAADVARKYEVAKRAIAEVRWDGQPRFSDPEEQRKVEAYALAPLQAAVESAHATADQAEQEAAKLESLRHADVWSSVPTEDLQRASVVRPLIADFVAEATPAELAGRLAWAVAHGSAVEKRLYLEEAGRRKDAYEQTHALLDQLVDPKLAAESLKASENAQTLRKKASQLRFATADMLAEVDGSKAAADAKRLREYRGYF